MTESDPVGSAPREGRPTEELMRERVPLLDGFTHEDVNSLKPELKEASNQPAGGYTVAREGVSFHEPLGDVLAAFRWVVAAGDELQIDPGGVHSAAAALGETWPDARRFACGLSKTHSRRVRPSVIRPALRAAGAIHCEPGVIHGHLNIPGLPTNELTLSFVAGALKWSREVG